jgi:uncharacterized protein
MVVNDSHIHVGQFYDKYYSSEYIHSVVSALKINKYLVSSTTICEENYTKVISEIQQLIKLDEEKVFPMLWVTPKMFISNELSLMIKSGINWKCIKIHGFIHNWPPNGNHFKQIIDLASVMQVPILIHSGGNKKCDAGSYLRVIKKHPEQMFILAHGRPIDEAVSVLKQTSNAYVDTAFMPLEDIKLLVDNAFEEKILFGTDFPITIHNEPNIPDTVWYKNLISEIVDIIGIDKFKIINEDNFNKLFC